MACAFKNMFGEVGTGVHSVRVFNLAIVDVISTVVGAYFISKFWGFSFINTLVSLFLVGIILHRIFCVRTTIDKILFQEE